MNILLTNHFIINYSGSELVIFDLARYFVGRGDHVYLASFEIRGSIKGHFDSLNVSWVDLALPLDHLARIEFDLIWGHHFTTFDAIFSSGHIHSKAVVFSSLSPFEPLEAPPLYTEYIDLFIANSVETRNALISVGITPERIQIFPNSISSSYLDKEMRPLVSPNRIAFVSNHMPIEVQDAARLLSFDGISSVLYGINHTVEYITPELLSEFDVVVTIGRTVVPALAVGSLVYCYDRFGGPGYITRSNFECAYETNFSGRCSPRHLTGSEIAQEVRQNYLQPSHDRTILRELIRRSHVFETNMAAALHILEYRQPVSHNGTNMKPLLKILERQQAFIIRLIKSHQVVPSGSKPLETPEMTLPRSVEVEVIHSLCVEQSMKFSPHFSPNHLTYVDNINGGFDQCPMPLMRETGVGLRYGSWVRARAIINALLDSMNLFPILAFLNPDKNIRGFGISDDARYANLLSEKFSFKNTFFHTEPRLDLMRFDPNFGDDIYDFCICTDVLEHVIGDWREALQNIYRYLKPGGILILSAPWSNSLQTTIEHYPSAIDYKSHFVDGVYDHTTISYNDGTTAAAPNPIFHGGPGNTLEMRFFALGEILSAAAKIGFSKFNTYDFNYPHFGIVAEPEAPNILVLEKRMS